MTEIKKVEETVYRAENTVQPISDDYFTDGTLPDFARVDHQHPLSASLRSKLLGSGSSNRNLIHNGQFKINQRLLLAYAAFAGQTAADRWLVTNNAVGVQTLRIMTNAGFAGGAFPAGRPTPGNIQNLLVTTIDAAPAAGDFTVISQAIEGQNLQHLNWGTVNAQPLTLSFDVFCTVTGVFVAELIFSGAVQRTISRQYSTVAGKWTTIKVSFPGDTAQIIPDDNLNRLQVEFFVEAGTTYTSGALQSSWGNITNANRAVGITNNYANTVNNTFAVTNVQLEVGSINTFYEVKEFADELAACQRYLETTGFICNVAPVPPHTSGYWKVPKRLTPVITIVLQGGVGGTVAAFAATFGETMGFYQNAANSVASNSLVTGQAEL